MKNNRSLNTSNTLESFNQHVEKSTFLKAYISRDNNINYLNKPLTLIRYHEVTHLQDNVHKIQKVFPETIIKNNLAKYQELYDFAPSAYFKLSRKDQIIELNPAGANMIGIPNIESRNQQFSSFVTDDTKTIFNQFIRNIFKSTERKTCEVSLFSDFNKLKYVKLTGIANEENNQCLVNVIDISSQKEAELSLIMAKKELAFQIYEKEILSEKLLIANENALNKVKFKSNLLANIGHEIKTPLNGILGYSELLKQSDLTQEMQQNCISMIEKGGIRLLNIVNDLITVAKQEAVENSVTITPCNINEQIEDIFNFFKLEVEQKGLQISFQNSLPNCEAIIDTDSEKIYGILTNLVKNAICYCDKGSIEIGYTFKTVDPVNSLFSGLFSGHREKARHIVNVEFFVKDTGIGVPINLQESIFERYIQVDKKDKRAAHGVGLGLAISKSYVEMLGGNIWVQSEPGNGSIFYFTIPYICKQSEYLINTNVKINHGIKDLKILIADDDLSLGMLQAELVKDHSIFVQYVNNGIEAVEASKINDDFDLILMDINMPKMNGFDAAEHIRKLNKDVIIIAQTVYPQEKEHDIALNSGCNDYIQKSLNKRTMFELLRKYFGNLQNLSGEKNIEMA
jgi:signal transduction histidine kinase/CheY-like chemotaxis protein